MDFNQNSNHPDNHFSQPPQRTSGFAIASMVCSIIAVAACCTGILGIPFGALSILFAVLSKRKGQKMSAMSLTGICLSVAGIVLGLLVTCYSLYLLVTDSALRQQMNALFETMYGMSLEEYFGLYAQKIL